MAQSGCCSVFLTLCMTYTLHFCTLSYVPLCPYRSGKDYAAVLAANVVGPFLVTKHFLPLFMKKKTRVIVNSSSICGSISATVVGGIGGENPLASVLLPYNTSKAALNMRKCCNWLIMLASCLAISTCSLSSMSRAPYLAPAAVITIIIANITNITPLSYAQPAWLCQVCSLVGFVACMLLAVAVASQTSKAPLDAYKLPFGLAVGLGRDSIRAGFSIVIVL